MALWTGSEVQRATGGALEGGGWEAGSVSIDSRTIGAGDLFVAIAGERFDGHDYVKQALEAGAVAAIVSRRPQGLPVGARLLVVEDVMAAFNALAKAARARSAVQVVGITGSVGKTSTKEMLALALGALGKTYFSQGNFNNHIGAPLNLANLPADARYAIFEMGMNHAGEISPLSRLIRPHVAVITGVEAVHLEFFDSERSIADAKCEIFDGLAEGGVAVLNADNAHYEYCKRRAQGKKILSFGTAEGADVRVTSYAIRNLKSQIALEVTGKKLEVTLGAVGQHWAGVAASVLAVVQALGGDVQKSAKALSAFREVAGRGTLEEIFVSQGRAVLIDDSYNASPASMRAAIAKLADVHAARAGKGRMVAVLGDMLELGEAAPALHVELAQELNRQGIQSVFAAGALMKHLFDALPPARRGGYAESAKGLLALVSSSLRPDDTVLVKGSHGSKIYALATALKDAAQDERGDRIAL